MFLWTGRYLVVFPDYSFPLFHLLPIPCSGSVDVAANKTFREPGFSYSQHRYVPISSPKPRSPDIRAHPAPTFHFHFTLIEVLKLV